MSLKPTGASRSTPSVPRKSRSPSARRCADVSSTPIAVATALSVTPAQATSASSSMSPEQASRPLPPVAGCRPAVTSARPVSTLQAMPASSMSPSAVSVMTAALGLVAVLLLERAPAGRGVSSASTPRASSGHDLDALAPAPCAALLGGEHALERAIETATWSSVGSRVVRRCSHRPGASTARTMRGVLEARREADDLVGQAGDQRQRDDARDDQPRSRVPTTSPSAAKTRIAMTITQSRNAVPQRTWMRL